ncbi:urease accessory protein UreD [Undibacterium parvum]|uniref:Urease accessory protein UreD n=1 Tax=Undibacterium parvum TaxID=401471 RepID=A0A3Q9BS20_9BURK|nr:urease accessory protein UreD [Undibacterium parvum]AZP13211.1 urease accessory protein UreD [Undibacterium parvum]
MSSDLALLDEQIIAAIAIAPWQAKLRLGFSDDGGTTRLTERSHVGPLRVQKALYPEGGQICHAIIVHPPGGVVGGDQLEIAMSVQANAHALLATPGAAKWYKANGKISKQSVQMTVQQAASVEWLPQETIFFDAAHVQLSQTINLAKDASFIGCDILCFGRTASGESFHSGKISQHSTIRREGKLIWFEQGAVTGGSLAMTGLLGLGGNTVCATLLAAGKTVPAAVIAALREEASALLAGAGSFGVTQLKAVIVVRYLGNASEMARALMLMAWRYLRPEIIGREAVALRIWNT